MQRERKLVPRFRRKNVHVDIDDQEDRRAIEEDLRSVFTWTSDATSTSTPTTTTLIDSGEEKEQRISLVDGKEDWRVDLGEDSTTWNIHFHSDEKISSQWIDEDEGQRKETKLSLDDETVRCVHWSTNDEDKHHISFNTGDSHLQSWNYQQDLIIDEQRPLLIEENSSKETCYSLLAGNSNLFPLESESISSTQLDTLIPSFVPLLSLPQSFIPELTLQGISTYSLSFPVDDLLRDYSPLSSFNLHLDAEHCSIIRWSLEILQRLRRSSVHWTLDDEDLREDQWSLIGEYHWRAIEETNNEQIYSLFDPFIERWKISSSADLCERRIYSLVDREEMKRTFGGEDERRDRFEEEKRLLEQLKTLTWNLPRRDLLAQLYSPQSEDGQIEEISFEKRFLFADEFSRRAWRRYRCKHFTHNKQNEHIDQLDLDPTSTSTLTFKGNESIAIGEEHYHTDLQQQEEQTVNPWPG